MIVWFLTPSPRRFSRYCEFVELLATTTTDVNPPLVGAMNRTAKFDTVPADTVAGQRSTAYALALGPLVVTPVSINVADPELVMENTFVYATFGRRTPKSVPLSPLHASSLSMTTPFVPSTAMLTAGDPSTWNDCSFVAPL